MNRSRWNSFCLALLLGTGPAAPEVLRAQEAAAASSQPVVRSPVDTFRELLAMTPEERRKAKAVADRSPEDQRLILAKIREYESLKPDVRELRLRVTELHWYLTPLMSSSTTDRAAQLALLPADTRKLVEARLQQWDLLKPDVQKELLANEQAMQLFIQLESSTPEARQKILDEMSPARRQRLQEDVARIREMPEAERRELGKRVNQFFDLTAREQGKALSTLSDPERQQMEKTLRAFEKMPDAQRELCIQSFTEFAKMSLAERQQFLKNAERWRRMKPNERQKWRDLVSKIPELPPNPPGIDDAVPPAPPGSPVSMATNGR